MANAEKQRRQCAQHRTQVWHKADKAACESSEVEEGHMQQPEDNRTDPANDERDDDIPHHEAPYHAGNLAKRSVSIPTIFEREQTYGGGAGVVLPGQHEESEEGNERSREHYFGDGSETAAQQFGEARGL